MKRKLFRMTLLMTSFIFSMIIAGCGMSGPLVLPKPTNTSVTNNNDTTTDSGDYSNGVNRSTAVKTVI